MNFATVADLADALGVAIPMDDPRAVQLLEAATDAIKSHCGQEIESVAEAVNDVPGFGETVLLDGGTEKLLLPQFPVLAVGEVLELEDTLTEGADQDYIWDRSGHLIRMGANWASGYRTVEVSYDHGYSTLPADLRAVCVSAAGRAYHEALAGESTDYQSRPGVALSEDERRMLDRKYRDWRAR